MIAHRSSSGEGRRSSSVGKCRSYTVQVAPSVRSAITPDRGGNVTVLTPNETIAARWNGALQTCLRQAPLENFLRSRGLKWALSGESRLTDNLACGTMFLLDGALNAFMLDCRGTLSAAQHPAVGQITCAVSHGLSTLIEESHSWRIAALVATVRCLAPYSGLDAAARVAAAAAREYSATLNAGSQSNRCGANRQRRRHGGGEQRQSARIARDGSDRPPPGNPDRRRDQRGGNPGAVIRSGRRDHQVVDDIIAVAWLSHPCGCNDPTTSACRTYRPTRGPTAPCPTPWCRNYPRQRRNALRWKGWNGGSRAG